MDEICEDLMILQEWIREEIREIEEIDPRMDDPLPRIERKYRTVDSFEDTEVRQLFRFESRDQLHRLGQGFQFPLEMVYGCCGNKFTGEEVLLCEIYRIRCINTLGDAGWKEMFGMVQSVCSLAWNLFFEYMWTWWSYLVFKNMTYWANKII